MPGSHCLQLRATTIYTRMFLINLLGASYCMQTHFVMSVQERSSIFLLTEEIVAAYVEIHMMQNL